MKRRLREVKKSNKVCYNELFELLESQMEKINTKPVKESKATKENMDVESPTTATTVTSQNSEPKRSKPTPKKSIQAKKQSDHIPILYLPCDEDSTQFLVYFHANAEDIGLAFDLLHAIGQRLRMHVIAVEYPGYGLYKTSVAGEQQIKEDSVIVYDYLTIVCGIPQDSICLFGRSMGSGPTSYLASIRKPHALILMSPYTSIKNAAKSILGWASFLGFMV